MRAERFEKGISAAIPNGYRLKLFEKGDETFWAAIETSVGEFDNQEEACRYFEDHYLADISHLRERCLFVLDEKDHYAGTCTAWFDRKENDTVGSLHWLAVKPEYQRKGLATALVSEVMKIFDISQSFPVYLHTQTWSYRAIIIYSHFGFRILKSQHFSQYKNDFEDAMPVLKKVINEKCFRELLKTAL
jgi:ribosomal protein S18 acetylase RimI-like enzyme